MFKKLLERFPIIGQFFKFALIGFMNAAIDFGILNVLMYASGQAEGVYYTVFKTLSFTAAVIFSYNLNKRWTFKDISEEERTKKFTQFLVISVIGAFINVTAATLTIFYIKPMFALPFLTDQLWGNIGAIVGSASGLVWNFLGYKFIVFKK